MFELRGHTTRRSAQQVHGNKLKLRCGACVCRLMVGTSGLWVSTMGEISCRLVITLEQTSLRRGTVGFSWTPHESYFRMPGRKRIVGINLVHRVPPTSSHSNEYRGYKWSKFFRLRRAKQTAATDELVPGVSG